MLGWESSSQRRYHFVENTIWMTVVFIQSLLILSGAVSLFIAISSTISWLRIPEPCPCGSHCTRIDKVEGRSDDIFYFDGQDGGQVTIYPDFIRRCILFVENVGDYQVKQHSEKLVEVCLSRRDEQVETAITEQFRLLGSTERV